MIYGHLAVVVFIVLSGFSLAVAPAQHGWQLNGLGRYAHRRAWRIQSAYWPALVLSIGSTSPDLNNIARTQSPPVCRFHIAPNRNNII
jgi:peptidoglycan/LPS O-acetylase OafA/YrhL